MLTHNVVTQLQSNKQKKKKNLPFCCFQFHVLPLQNKYLECVNNCQWKPSEDSRPIKLHLRPYKSNFEMIFRQLQPTYSSKRKRGKFAKMNSKLIFAIIGILFAIATFAEGIYILIHISKKKT